MCVCFIFALIFRWHDAGTYDVNTKTGGPNGSIRSEEEYSHGSNSGLKKAIDWCGKVFQFHANTACCSEIHVFDSLIESILKSKPHVAG